jgi:serine/threonine protein phosphatase 1
MWQKLLQLQFAPNPGEVLRWMVKARAEPPVCACGGDLRHGFAAARDGPPHDHPVDRGTAREMNAALGHDTLFSALRRAAFTESRGLLLVHAAIAPTRPLAAQGDAFWWGGDDLLALTAPFEGFRRVVRGVDRQQRGLVEREFAGSLDGGAGRGGRLIAACFAADSSVLDQIEA